jgi:hypothetical protein
MTSGPASPAPSRSRTGSAPHGRYEGSRTTRESATRKSDSTTRSRCVRRRGRGRRSAEIAAVIARGRCSRRGRRRRPPAAFQASRRRSIRRVGTPFDSISATCPNVSWSAKCARWSRCRLTCGGHTGWLQSVSEPRGCPSCAYLARARICAGQMVPPADSNLRPSAPEAAQRRPRRSVGVHGRLPADLENTA